MSHKDIEEFDLLEVDKLIDEESCPRADEEYIFRVKLNSAFIDYVTRSFDLRYYDPELMKDMRDSIIRMCEHIVGNLGDGESSMTSDDIATMIDTVLSDKGEYSSISYKRVCTALDFMYDGQTHVDSKLNKYLPHILETIRFSFDDEEDGCDVPVNLYKRIVAYSRAVAGTSITLDECLFAAINMGYAADVLADVEGLSGREYYAVLCDLRTFIQISLDVAGKNPRVLYRLYMPMRSLFVGLGLYGLDGEINDFAKYLISLEIEDEEAPLLPNLFIGSMIYANAQKGNEPLRLHLRELREEVEQGAEYDSYRAAYTPEFMYIDIDLQSEEESAAALSDFNISFADEDDLSDYNFDDDDEWPSDDNTSSDVGDDGWDDSDDGMIEELTPAVIRAMWEAQGIDTSSLDDEMLMAMFGDVCGLSDTDSAEDLNAIFNDDDALLDFIMEDDVEDNVKDTIEWDDDEMMRLVFGEDEENEIMEDLDDIDSDH